MRTTTGTKNKIKQFEGLRLKAYVCAAGVCTIGYGHTTGVKPGKRASPSFGTVPV